MDRKRKDIDHLIKTWSEIYNEEEESILEPIGTISKSLKDKYITWIHENEDFQAETAFKKEQLEKQAEREMEKLFSERFQSLIRRKEEIWESVRTEINLLDNDISLNFNPDTGVISKWVKNEILGD